jgi:hypothetical protein
VPLPLARHGGGRSRTHRLDLSPVARGSSDWCPATLSDGRPRSAQYAERQTKIIEVGRRNVNLCPLIVGVFCHMPVA